MAREFFDQVHDALVGFLPPELGDVHYRVSGRNLKVWFGDATKEHYEVQMVKGGLEVGFHAEHTTVARNDEVLSALLAAERSWRRKLGRAADAGPFLGGLGSVWRRVSEVWDEPELDTDAALEAADRLSTYIRALEPVRAGP